MSHNTKLAISNLLGLPAMVGMGLLAAVVAGGAVAHTGQPLAIISAKADARAAEFNQHHRVSGARDYAALPQ